MKRKNGFRLAVGTGLAVALLLGGAGAANATTVQAGGGTWTYDVDYLNTGVAYSNYFHTKKSHGSTACSRDACVRSDTVPSGRWSYARVKATAGGNTAYWRV
ncbi:lactococcin 972 family bacteriocin [Clavibacter michiganensis]|uniref:lactococcin 972 family bacteriocin n=1 Tax=Clavibacter michiganensis TaxID=28447 RepID=UPI001959344A|nr:lactococcin 972 family bacteriocin [Clavibacter michiganensis]MBM7413023.1 lactococcin 972 family bacteriocin [Clavibacter michiganensis]